MVKKQLGFRYLTSGIEISIELDDIEPFSLAKARSPISTTPCKSILHSISEKFKNARSGIADSCPSVDRLKKFHLYLYPFHNWP